MGGKNSRLTPTARLADRQKLHGPFDICLLVNTDAFFCHKKVLKEHSRYFKTMFTNFEEKDKSKVEMKDLVDTRIVTSVIDYMYFGEIQVTPINVQELLCIADYLHIESLTSLCCNYITARLNKKNCLQLYVFAQTRGPFDLFLDVEKFIVENFESISTKSKAFGYLTGKQLMRIIADDRLKISSELIICKAIFNWLDKRLNADPNSSMSSETDACIAILPDLLNLVQFPLMMYEEINAVAKMLQTRSWNSSLNLCRLECSRILRDARVYYKKSCEEKISVWNSKKKPSRWPKIFVVMRMYWKNIRMEYYDFKVHEWEILTEVQNWRSCTAIVGVGSVIYMLGGEEIDLHSPTGSRTVNRVTCYDCENNKWYSGHSMQLARRWSGAVVHNSKLYVIGGIGGKGGTYEKRLSSVECLDVETTTWTSGSTSKWRLLQPMSTPRSSHSVDVLDGYLYVVGGGNGHEWLCTAERYDIQTNTWSSISDLNMKRWKCGLCSLNGYLYAIGGMESPQAGFWGVPLKSVERYDPRTDKWTVVESMQIARFGCAVVAHQGLIWVTGGFGQEKAILSTTEVYDPRIDKWGRTDNMYKMCGFVGGALVNKPIRLICSDLRPCLETPTW